MYIELINFVNVTFLDYVSSTFLTFHFDNLVKFSLILDIMK